MKLYGLNADLFAGYDVAQLYPWLRRLSRGDAAGAAAAFKKAAARAPRLAGPYLLLGRAYARASQERKAVAALDRATARHPDALAGFACLLGLQVPFNEAPGPGARGGSSDRTVRRALDRRIKRDPRCWWAYALRGSCLFKDKNRRPQVLERAEADLRRALALRPSCGWIYAFQAQLLWNHKTAEALKAVSIGSRLLPSSGWILAWKAQILGKTGSGRQAETDFNRALRLSPDYALAYGLRGVLRLQLGKLLQAEKDLLKALSLHPKHGVSWAALGDIRRRQGRPQEALENLSRSVLCEPEAARSFAFSRDPRAIASAARELEGYLRRRPGEIVAGLWLGELYLRRGLHQKSLPLFGRFIAAVSDADETLHPLLGWAYRWRAEANGKLGRAAASRKDSRSALRVNPNLDFFPGC